MWHCLWRQRINYSTCKMQQNTCWREPVNMMMWVLHYYKGYFWLPVCPIWSQRFLIQQNGYGCELAMEQDSLTFGIYARDSDPLHPLLSCCFSTEAEPQRPLIIWARGKKGERWGTVKAAERPCDKSACWRNCDYKQQPSECPSHQPGKALLTRAFGYSPVSCVSESTDWQGLIDKVGGEKASFSIPRNAKYDEAY